MRRYGSQKNHLLMKAEVGKGKPSYYNLPNREFAYGKQTGMNQSMRVKENMEWRIEKPRIKQSYQYVDFMKMNKYNVSQLNKKQNEQVTSRIGRGQKVYNIRLPEEGFTYGLKNKPSTPMKNVMKNVYGWIGEQEQKQNQEYYVNMHRQEEKQMKAHLNRTHQRSQSMGFKASQTQEAFKLPRFKNIKSKLNC